MIQIPLGLAPKNNFKPKLQIFLEGKPLEASRKFGITPRKMPLAPVSFFRRDLSVHKVSHCSDHVKLRLTSPTYNGTSETACLISSTLKPRHYSQQTLSQCHNQFFITDKDSRKQSKELFKNKVVPFLVDVFSRVNWLRS